MNGLSTEPQLDLLKLYQVVTEGMGTTECLRLVQLLSASQLGVKAAAMVETYLAAEIAAKAAPNDPEGRVQDEVDRTLLGSLLAEYLDWRRDMIRLEPITWPAWCRAPTCCCRKARPTMS